MITTNGSTVITRPIAEVFDFLADARNEPQWLPGAVNVRLTSAEPVGIGSVFEGKYARAGVVTIRLVRFEAPNHITFAGDAKRLTFIDEVSLEPTDYGTALSATMTTTPKGIFRLMAPVMGRVIGKQFQSNWDRLTETLDA